MVLVITEVLNYFKLKRKKKTKKNTLSNLTSYFQLFHFQENFSLLEEEKKLLDRIENDVDCDLEGML